jgi:hypothetical protein
VTIGHWRVLGSDRARVANQYTPVAAKAEQIAVLLDNDMPHELDVWQDTVRMAATHTDGTPRDIYIHIILTSVR